MNFYINLICSDLNNEEMIFPCSYFIFNFTSSSIGNTVSTNKLI